VTFTTFIRKHCKARDMRAALSCLGAMRRAGVRPNDRTYNTLIQGWIELKRMDRAMDLFREMKRRKVRPDVVTYNLLISGWARQMKRMDKAEEVMNDLMNNPMVSPNTRTFDSLINGYRCMFREDRHWRTERMYFWLCQMRDFKIQPNPHTAKHFNKMNLYFPSVDGPFWTRDFGMAFDPQRHDHRYAR
jgi:pentatricopeptide repeat protein